MKENLPNHSGTQKISLLLITLLFASCATSTSIKSNATASKSHVPSTKDGFASESVREAYLRLKKPDYTEQDKKIDEEQSAKIAKAQSKSMINGASTLDGLNNYKGKTYYLEGAEELNLENNYFDIPVTYNAQVKKWISYFLNRGRDYFERYTERAGRYAPILGAILEEHGLPRDLIFLAMAESGFNNVAKSWAAAVGPWQFMPYTGKMYGLDQDWYRDERRDPIKATVAAARYLAKLYDDFGQWEVAAAAYNAGEGKLGRAIKKYKSEDFWHLTKGRYLKDETKNYVPKIMALAIIGKNLKSFGFDDVEFHEPLDFEEITVPGSTDLIKLSEMMGVDFEEIQRLNPEVLRWFTPPSIAEYKLRLPPNTASKFAECCLNTDLTAVNFQQFVVPKKGMTLSQVSKKFKLRKDYVLANLNNVSEKSRFNAGDVVKLPFRDGEEVSPNNNLYADLFEKPRREVLRKNSRAYRARRYAARKKPFRYYTVKKGETLFSVAQKHGISVKRLIASNNDLIDKKSKKVNAGTKLSIK
ncbi:MAG: transglycosylase SLT domain-containing protein [Bacteriovoracaceae bacterium]|nr:transglycosylase SLT domain-containing protein [Bacteriovoracaceae bacterium]